MKTTPLYIAALLVSAVLGSAQQTFPGLKSVLTVAEWQRAGVIDAALIRHQSGVTARLQSELATAQPPAASPAVAGAPKKPAPATFGLPVYDENDWRNVAPLKARVTKWEGGNRFLLDNGQLWEGFEPITYDLVGKEIEIQARPHGQFNLAVEGVNTTVRVLRVR
jgi:hypothetical protein